MLVVLLALLPVSVFGQLTHTGSAGSTTVDSANFAKLTSPTFTGNVKIGSDTTTLPFVVSGGTAGGGATGVTTAGFINNTDADQWVRFKSGLTGNYRSYLAWYDYTGGENYRWLMGKNNGGTTGNFILYDKSTGGGHRFYFLATGGGMTNAGRTNIMSNGTESVVINGANWDDQQGTGGFKVYGGGAGTAPLWTTIDSNGVNIRRGNLMITPLVDTNATLEIHGGLSTRRTAYVTFFDQATQKWFIGKHNTADDFRIYNYGISAYALHISAATNKIGIGNTAPDSTLHVTGSFKATGNAIIGGSLAWTVPDSTTAAGAGYPTGTVYVGAAGYLKAK